MADSGIDLSRIGQIGIIVKDLDAAMERYWKILGIGPWKIHTAGRPPYRAVFRGRPISYLARIGVAPAGPVNLELMQPLEGEGTYKEFVEKHGEGLHHVAIYVKELDEALAQLAGHGVQVLQRMDGTGLKGDGRVAYLDTEAVFGTILELIQSPSERLVERTYP